MIEFQAFAKVVFVSSRSVSTSFPLYWLAFVPYVILFSNIVVNVVSFLLFCRFPFGLYYSWTVTLFMSYIF